MNINNLMLYNSKTRIFGLSGSGLDPDEMVSQLMRAERIPLDRLYQKRQVAEWRRDEYRNITNLLRGLKDEYFNVLKPSNYLLSQSTYKKFESVSSDSSIVSATANADAFVGSHTILVNEIATAAVSVSTAGLTKPIVGSSLPSVEAAKGKSFTISIDGVAKTITIDSSVTDIPGLIADIQSSLDEAFGMIDGQSKVTIGDTAGDGTGFLTFTPNSAKGINRIVVSSGSSETGDALNALGFSTVAVNRLNTWESLETVASKLNNPFTFDADGKLNLTINGKKFSFDKSVSLSAMMSQINSDPNAGVIMQYDEVTDAFRITSKQLGSGLGKITLDEKDSTFLTSVSFSYTEGKDASVTIDGTQTIIRSSNTFTVNGVTYSIHKKSDVEQKITLTQDVQGIYDTIKSFVEKYNEVIKKINDEISEKYDRNYLPLTEEQKKAMSEDDIKLWEEKAKTGLLRNDPILQNIVYNMRKALSDSVSGVSLNLSSIGITTGSYEEKGKLIIDEAKLKAAIQDNPDGVMNLFCKKSSVDDNINLTSDQRDKRYSEEGLAYRLFDIIEDNIRTRRDNNNRKGLLLEKAGIEGDFSEIQNEIWREIRDYDNDIEELQKKLINKENAYYEKYARLETILSRMIAQSNYLMSQLSQR